MQRSRRMTLLGALLLLPLFLSCQSQEPELQIDYEQYELDNGLSVVLHEDHSDPVAAVAIPIRLLMIVVVGHRELSPIRYDCQPE